MRILCLCNPASGARPERLEALQRFARRVTGASVQMEVVATASAAEAEQALAAGGLEPTDLLLLSGGDGTIQHALSWLLHGAPDQQTTRSASRRATDLPAVALLPGGSTNMTALDINRTRGWQACLQAFLQHIDGGLHLPAAERRLLSVQDGDQVRVGFFVGGGAIVRGIEYCNDVLWAGGAARQERTAGLAMARTIWGVVRQQPPFDAVDPLRLEAYEEAVVSAPMTPATPVTPSTPGEPALALAPESGALLFASSTLERLVVGVRPFWGEPESEPLRYVLVERDAQLLRGLPGLLGVPGFSRPVASRGFHSHNCTRLVLHMRSAYAIDGELFVPQTGVLELSVERSLRFLLL